jgi:hypothetical protein
MLVCVGRGGLGPYQVLEVDQAMILRDQGRIDVRIVRLGELTHDELLRNEPMLAGYAGLTFKYPGNAKEKNSLLVIRELLEKARAPAQASAVDGARPAGRDAHSSVLEELSENITSGGLACFLGSVWPDRDKGAFDPRRLIEKVLNETKLDQSKMVGLDWAATARDPGQPQSGRCHPR